MTASRRAAAATAIAAVLGLAACGGGDDKTSTATATVARNPASVNSGKIDLDARLTIEQAAGEGGSVAVRLRGPFEASADGELPDFDLDVSGVYSNPDAGDRYPFAGGLVASDGKTYLRFDGKTYELGDPFTSLADRVRDVSSPGALRLIDGLKFEGDGQVAGTPTRDYSGSLDFDAAVKLLGDLGSDPEALGLAKNSIIAEVNPEAVTGLAKQSHMEASLGKLDGLPRHLEVDVAFAGVSVKRARLEVTAGFSEVNQPQSIEPPADPRPYLDLFKVPTVGLYGVLLGIPEAQKLYPHGFGVS
jgi:hypothetical protein